LRSRRPLRHITALLLLLLLLVLLIRHCRSTPPQLGGQPKPSV
jgi:hypothetical protein